MKHSTPPWMVLLARLSLLLKFRLLSLLQGLDLLDLVDLLPKLKLLAKLHFLSMLDLQNLPPVSTLFVPASSLTASPSSRLSTVPKSLGWSLSISSSSVMDGWSLYVTILCSGVTNENETLLLGAGFGHGIRFEAVMMACSDFVFLSVPWSKALFAS